MDWKKELKYYFGERCILSADMGQYTTYKTGGPAEALVRPDNAEDWLFVLKLANTSGVPLRVFGIGSNILVSPRGVDGVICSTRGANQIKIDDNILEAQAGAELDDIIAATVDAGLEGLQNLSGIPGSAGGAVYMNAGAYDGETFDNLVSFDALDAGGNIKTFKKEDVKHSYRKVEGVDGLIIIKVIWDLKRATDVAALKARREEILKKRAEKQPLEYPSAGSVFKRPAGNYASKLIDECGLRGLKIGGAMVSQKHAGFIINYDNATPADIKNLMDEVMRRVFDAAGVKLELEQILWGEF